MLGVRCRLLLRTGDPANPPPPEGNILLDQMAGAEIVWITPQEYINRAAIFEREAEALRKEGRHPYIIPEGASNPVGTWGYIRAAEELAADIERLPGGSKKPTTVIHATGSGGTAAGFLLGARLAGMKARMVSFNVCDDPRLFRFRAHRRNLRTDDRIVRPRDRLRPRTRRRRHRRLRGPRLRPGEPRRTGPLLRSGPNGRDLPGPVVYGQSLLRHGSGTPTQSRLLRGAGHLRPYRGNIRAFPHGSGDCPRCCDMTG